MKTLWRHENGPGKEGLQQTSLSYGNDGHEPYWSKSARAERATDPWGNHGTRGTRFRFRSFTDVEHPRGITTGSYGFDPLTHFFRTRLGGTLAADDNFCDAAAAWRETTRSDWNCNHNVSLFLSAFATHCAAATSKNFAAIIEIRVKRETYFAPEIPTYWRAPIVIATPPHGQRCYWDYIRTSTRSAMRLSKYLNRDGLICRNLLPLIISMNE